MTNATTQVDAVRRLHTRDSTNPANGCMECKEHRWPCPTRAIVGEEEE